MKFYDKEKLGEGKNFFFIMHYKIIMHYFTPQRKENNLFKTLELNNFLFLVFTGLTLRRFPLYTQARDKFSSFYYFPNSNAYYKTAATMKDFHHGKDVVKTCCCDRPNVHHTSSREN